jgi:hypothetical protein
LPKDESYTVTRDIPVTIKPVDLEFVAEIDAANLAATGSTLSDAFQNLVAEVLDAFDYLTANEARLGPGPAQQLAHLKGHLAKAND